jgi:glutathione synthase
MVQAYSLGPLFAILTDAVRRDEAWLERVLARTAEVDPFTGRLLHIARAVRALDGAERQQSVLGLLRSDYMLSQEGKEEPRLLQVELNTVSSSFACLSETVSGLHRFLDGRLEDGSAGWEEGSSLVNRPGAFVEGLVQPPLAKGDTVPVGEGGTRTDVASWMSTSLPANHSGDGWALGMVGALRDYCRQGLSSDPAEVGVLFVVQPGERNFADQRKLEGLLWDRFGVRSVRKTHRELLGDLRIGPSESDAEWGCSNPPPAGTSLAARKLFVSVGLGAPASSTEGEKLPAWKGACEWMEVGLVYFRSGYTPTDYPDSDHWIARETLERSAAIKCPDLWLHLAGAKKVQQVLADPGQVERFVGRGEEAAALRECFAGLWPLGEDSPSEDTRKAIEDAIRRPERYVVKPQREGGGNNLFGSAVREALSEWPLAKLRGYILMERLWPRVRDAVFVREGVSTTLPALCEVGVFTCLLGTGGPRNSPPSGFYEAAEGVAINATVGHLLRTKGAETDEGGVAAGFAVIDSPKLVL